MAAVGVAVSLSAIPVSWRMAAGGVWETLLVPIDHPHVPRFVAFRAAVETPALRHASACGSIERGALQGMVDEAARQHHVPAGVLLSMVKRESAGQPCAVSRSGARGILQLMPDTARTLGVRRIHDPAENLDAGARYLRQLLNRYGNDLRLALAAYNAGPRMVDEYGGVPPFRETQAYVAGIIASAR